MRHSFILIVSVLFCLNAPAAWAEETAAESACLLATKKYSAGAVVVDDGVALLCQTGGRWQMGEQVVHCVSQGKAHSDGGRIVAPGPNGPIIQICKKGRWTDHYAASPAHKAALSGH